MYVSPCIQVSRKQEVNRFLKIQFVIVSRAGGLRGSINLIIGILPNGGIYHVAICLN